MKRQLIIITIIALFALIAASAVAAEESNDTDSTVMTDNNENPETVLQDPYNPRTGESYTTIQAAINDPLTLDGDTIEVEPGTYTENVFVNKRLYIIATGEGTILNGFFNILATGSGSTIQGFNINQNYPSNGILLSGASNVLIKDNTINGFGNGIYLQNANYNTITGNTINGCSGIGIFLNPNANYNQITENNLNNNGGGIYFWTSNYNNIENNIITNITFDGIVTDSSTGNTIKGNMVSNCNRFGFSSNYYENIITYNTIINNAIGIRLRNYVTNIKSETINYNRIANNTNYNLLHEAGGSGIPNALYNWWGSNDQAAIAAKISGLANYSPWLYMTIAADPTTILFGEQSTITVSFNNYISDGVNPTPFDPALGHIPDGTPVNFNTDLGNIGSKTVDKETLNGVATATLTADETVGVAHVNAVTDSQTVYTEVNIDQIGTATDAENKNNFAGQNVDLTAQVEDDNGKNVNEGQVQFTVNGEIVGTADVVNGLATYTWTIPGTWNAANYPILADYLGTANYLTSTDTATLTVDKTPTNTQTTNKNNFAGQNVDLTANVTDFYGDNVNEGQVQFTVNGEIVATANVINGQATYTWTIPTTWNAGNYPILADYQGTNNYLPSTDTATLTVHPLPKASFTGSPTSGRANLTVKFTNNSTGATSYVWDFGDGGKSTEKNPIHTYTKPGTYTVKLTVKGPGGTHTQTLTKYITVKLPDLVMQSVTAPTTSRRGRYIRVSSRVRNSGTISTGKGFYVAFYLRSTKTSRRYYLGRRWVGNLGAGISSYKTNYFRVPQNLPRGRYYIQGVADYTKRIRETTRTNNIKYTTTRTRIS